MCPILCGASITRFMGMEPTLPVVGTMDNQECVPSVVQQVIKMTTVQVEYAVMFMMFLQSKVTGTDLKKNW